MYHSKVDTVPEAVYPCYFGKYSDRSVTLEVGSLVPRRSVLITLKGIASARTVIY